MGRHHDIVQSLDELAALKNHRCGGGDRTVRDYRDLQTRAFHVRACEVEEQAKD